MAYLLSITVLWAFSFSLIGVYLAGQVDAWFAAWSRILLATLVFLPLLKWRALPIALSSQLMLIGGVQIGLMYGFYYHAFLYLSVPEVLLMTVMTPVYITLLNDFLNRSFDWRYLLVAVLAVLGAVAIRFEGLNIQYWLGVLLVQGANLCFAFGQVMYKRLDKHITISHSQRFGWFFIGALLVSSVSLAIFADFNKLPQTQLQWGILAYLGLVASGVGYLAWNKGATLVSVGTLAVMNNLLIPVGILVNILIWHKPSDPLKLTLGSAVILAALWLDQYLNQKRAPSK
ncbi:EamA family transporter [Pseudoalteromonas fenneropenaei]|uniref:EamA family transporter n=1 Tax=Pseudoalteromonas fenneropenaei TaxID=1737459 RepID=A0ABV7CG26_9GAMM